MHCAAEDVDIQTIFNPMSKTNSLSLFMICHSHIFKSMCESVWNTPTKFTK